jgi:hypothetical protein
MLHFCMNPLDIRSPGSDHEHEKLVKLEGAFPTLPSFPAQQLGADRGSLLAGITFVELCTSWGNKELLQWFTAHGATMGWMSTPGAVRDAGVGSIALKAGGRMVGDRVARAEDLPKLLAMTRWKVIVTLRGLFNGDDRFLHAAIFAGRVRRDDKHPQWLARPHETDLLSDVVLSLFAADVLAHRDYHDQNLCICDVCGRVSYNPKVTTRAGCADHVPGTATSSGVRDRGGSIPSTIPPPMNLSSVPPPPAVVRSPYPGTPAAPAQARAATEPPVTPKLGKKK